MNNFKTLIYIIMPTFFAMYSYNIIYLSIPFQAIIIPLSVHNLGQGLAKRYPIWLQTICNAFAIKLLQATPPDTTYKISLYLTYYMKHVIKITI